MRSDPDKPKAGRTDPDRSRLYRELISQNKRGSTIGRLLDAQRERRRQIELVMQAQRERRARRIG